MVMGCKLWLLVANYTKARDWFFLLDIGGAWVTTVFPVKFCWVYSTQSENPTQFRVLANVKEGMLINLELSLNPNLTKVTITSLT